jgi:dephospho-CoA kinase
MKLAVGLTGGIGSGKSTVAARFAALGAAVVDTDALAHALTGPGGAAMGAIREAFGPGFVAADGSLDRAAMRRAAFEDPQARRRLEAILHPLIGERAASEMARATGAYVIVVVPLLFESGALLRRVQRTLAVDCPEALQVERTVRRSGLAAEEVRRIMSAQWPRWRRLQAADDVIWNGGGEEALPPQVERLHRAYSALARR